jgi:hypothetical protein
MEKFIPYVKLPKRLKREADKRRRKSWGSLNPVTRKPPNPKAYDRKKARKRSQDDDFGSVFFIFCSLAAGSDLTLQAC